MQNYIDNTGVQVADVVVGLVHLEGKTLETTRDLLAGLKEARLLVDYYCWDPLCAGQPVVYGHRSG